jgi:hypothetical protein
MVLAVVPLPSTICSHRRIGQIRNTETAASA